MFVLLPSSVFSAALRIDRRRCVVALLHLSARLHLQESIPQHRSTLNLVQSDQMNRVLFFLTLITATSVPVTFLTGLWGMNFV